MPSSASATAPPPPPRSALRTLLAYLVHLYTSLGLPLALLQVLAIFHHASFPAFALLNALAVLIDATDGFLARSANVRLHAPSFDGALLDNITDFLTFTFLPALALIHLTPLSLSHTLPLAFLSLLSSAYQFCHTSAKTPESFVGFPSYWNILLLHIHVLAPPYPLTAILYISLSILSFLPVHFIYPSKTKFLRPITLTLAAAWTLAIMAPVVAPEWKPAGDVMLASVVFPVYYTAASAYLQFTGYFDRASENEEKKEKAAKKE